MSLIPSPSEAEAIARAKPLVVRFQDLAQAFAPLHKWFAPDVKNLHDIWKMGAPAPDSRILVPDHYDERLNQRGNLEKRIVFPTPLATWIMEVSARRGMPLTMKQALQMLGGKADFGVEGRSVL